MTDPSTPSGAGASGKNGDHGGGGSSSPRLPSPLHQALAVIERLERKVKRLERGERRAREPIAIIGMGCRFPGGADSPESFWELLREGRDAITEVPRSRWNVDEFYAPSPGTPGKTYARHGGFIDDVEQFDPQFFAISPREAAAMDPQQRLVLEVSWEALERAGLTPRALPQTRTGVFVGVGPGEYSGATLRVGGRALESLDSHHATGTAPSAIAGRVAYFLKLQGPCMAIDTACSSALVAVHNAVRSLRAGACDVALAGGVNVLLSPEQFIAGSQARMLSASGRCRTFDARADGYVRGEGCGVVVLRRLSDARAQGDTILAVIRGSAINHDGPSSGFTVPNGRSQESLLRLALADARIAPERVSYVEAHGTGTALGDPIEVSALAAVYGKPRSVERPLLIGSVKTNIGHLEPAAGIAGLIKTVLALQHGELPGHLHLNEPNPHIAWDELAVEVSRTRQPWPEDEGARVAGVSAFGLSGTNAHVLLEQPPVEPAPASARPESSHYLLTLSGQREEVLNLLAGRYASFLRKHPEVELADVCHTANTGRVHHAHRLALVSSSRANLASDLESIAAGERPPSCVHGVRPLGGGPPKIAFLFTGQGSQYAGMGRTLYASEPVFREAIDQCDKLLTGYLDVPLRELLLVGQGARFSEPQRLHQTLYTQPALFALEYGLYRLWRSWGIRPDAVLGHSVGEFVAACVAGVFSLEDGLRLVAARGRLMHALRSRGAMAVVYAAPARVRIAITPWAGRVSVAALNGPVTTVISGDARAIVEVCERLASIKIHTKRLSVSQAFHSPLMDPILDDFEAEVRKLRLARPTLPLIGNVTGRRVDLEVTRPSYWRQHAREPVRFAECMGALEQLGCTTFVELGPHPVLLAMGTECVPLLDGTWLPTLRRGRQDAEIALQSLARLHVQGVEVDFRGLDRPFARRRVTLPSYPFQRQRCWSVQAEPRAHAARGPLRLPGVEIHPLLGQRVPNPGRDVHYISQLSHRTQPYLEGHRLFDAQVVPPAYYISTLLAAARDVFGVEAVALEDVLLPRPLVLSEPTHVHVQLGPGEHGRMGFQLTSARSADAREAIWHKHALGKMRRVESTSEPWRPVALGELQARCREEPSLDKLYERFAESGIEFGDHFRSLLRLWRNEDEAVALLDAPTLVEGRDDCLHPTVIDACLQVLAAVLSRRGHTSAFVPFSVERVSLLRHPTNSLWCHGQLRPAEGRASASWTGDLWLFDDEGQPIAELRGLRIREAAREDLDDARALADGDWQYRLAWRKLPAPTRPPHAPRPGAWLVLLDRDPVGEAIASALEERGHTCIRVSPGFGFMRNGPREYTLDPARRGDFTRLLQTIASSGETLGGVLYLWALEECRVDDSLHFERAQRRVCGGPLNLLQALALGHDATRPRRLLLVTRGAQAPHPPRTPLAIIQSPLWGLGRVIAEEHPDLHSALIDLDPDAPPADAAETLLDELTVEDGEDQISYRDGARYGARLVRYTPSKTASPRGLAVPDSEAFRLEIRQQGALDNLVLKPARRQPPGPGEVEVAVRAAALNFRDVLSALGMGRDVGGPLGGECAGTVVAVGEGVSHVSLGDSVMALAPSSFGPYVTADARHVVRKPDTLSIEEAATLPVAYLTAWYGLHHLGRILPGDRVLIHAAAGGVGMAAVQLAQRIGAEVHATASPGKWGVLRKLGVAHIYNSRTLDFVEGVTRETGGRGVNIVLNSLTGDFIPAGMSLLAPGGRFVELGKSGIWSSQHAAARFPGIAYRAFDLMSVDPDLLHQALRQIAEVIEQGELAALPRRTYPVTEAVSAFRYMAQARHVGKVVLSIETGTNERADVRPPPIDPGGAYLVTGGFGALGRQVARWLVDNGARHLVLVGRSEPSPDAQVDLESLTASGASVTAARVDVTNRAQLAALLDELSRDAPPLRGVIHAAGVVDDGVLQQQGWERFRKVLAPKVDGAWYLHELTQQTPLDFFVLFSSMASLMGPAGQGNYAAANAFLDALAHHRRAVGLPAISINWGPWAGPGMAGRITANARRRFAERGFGVIDPERGLAVFGRALSLDRAQIGVLPVDWNALRVQRQQRHVPRMLEALLPQPPRASSGASRAPDLLRRLRDLDPTARRELLRIALQAHAARILGLGAPGEIAGDRSLKEIGLDSLMAVELRNAICETIGRPLPATFVFDHPTIDGMIEHLLRRVIALESPDLEGDGPLPEDLAAIATLSPGRVRVHADPELPRDYAGVLDRAARIQTYLVTLSPGHVLEIITAGAESSPPLVLLPPISATASIWQFQIDHFASDYHVIIPHYPGYGRSTMTPGSTAPEALAAQLALALDGLGVTAPLNVVGWSYGGMIAQRFAHQSPDRVRSLSLVNTTAYFSGRDNTRQASDILRKLKDERTRNVSGSPGSQSATRIWALLKHAQGPTDAAVNIHYGDHAVRFDSRPQLHRIRIPTLIVQGVNDHFTPPSHGRLLCRKIPGARYYEFLSVGHYVPLHRSQIFNRCLERFLTTPDRRTSEPHPAAILRPLTTN
ncbi:MAG: alpha/beta fold hydrolase [Myxococcales bacterium]|nr:alpha/beta fold hydrolase [Myxococcales bacterium]MCB9749593.1 alpha/beta fold hydrolase [Myxococcales bacterium]